MPCNIPRVECDKGKVSTRDVIDIINMTSTRLCALEESNGGSLSALEQCCIEMRACCEDLRARVEALETTVARHEEMLIRIDGTLLTLNDRLTVVEQRDFLNC